MHYPAPSWLPGGHLQTIYPATCIAKPPVAYRRERWHSADGDFVDLDFVDGQPGQPWWCCSMVWKAVPIAITPAA